MGDGCPFCRGTGQASAIRWGVDPRPPVMMQPVYDPAGPGFYLCLIANGRRIGVTETAESLDAALGLAIPLAGRLGYRLADCDPAFTVRDEA